MTLIFFLGGGGGGEEVRWKTVRTYGKILATPLLWCLVPEKCYASFKISPYLCWGRTCYLVKLQRT